MISYVFMAAGGGGYIKVIAVESQNDQFNEGKALAPP
jgi:hypothetical protein